MKKIIIGICLILLTFSTGYIYAKTYYYVYMKNGSNKCEITTRDQDKFKRAKGSSWKFIGKDTTRSGAKKIAKENGCK